MLSFDLHTFAKVAQNEEVTHRRPQNYRKAQVRTKLAFVMLELLIKEVLVL